jgi:hypothetical protein
MVGQKTVLMSNIELQQYITAASGIVKSRIAFGTEHGDIIINDISTRSEVNRIKAANHFCQADISLRSKLLYGIGGTSHVSRKSIGNSLSIIHKNGKMDRLDNVQHSNTITGVAAYGKRKAISIDCDGNIAFWNNRKHIKNYATGYNLTCCCSDNNQDTSAIGTEEGSILVLENDIPHRLNHTYRGLHNSGWSALSMSINPLRIVAVSLNGFISYCDKNSSIGNKFDSLQCTCAAISSNGELIAYGNINGEIKIVKNSKEELSLICNSCFHMGEVKALAFNYNGTKIISSGNDGLINCIDVDKNDIDFRTQCPESVIVLKYIKQNMILAIGETGLSLLYKTH